MRTDRPIPARCRRRASPGSGLERERWLVLAEHGGEDVHRCLVRVREVVEHDDDGDAFRGRVEPVAAPAAQGAAVGGDRAAEFVAPAEAETVCCWRSVGECHWCGEAAVQRVGVVTRRVDVTLPGDHVIEAGAEAGVAGPHDAVLCGTEAAGGGAFVALGAVGHGARVGRQQRSLHAGGVEYAGAQQVGEASAGALLHDLGQQAEVLVDVGVPRAGAKCRVRVPAMMRAASVSPNGASAGEPCSIATAQ